VTSVALMIRVDEALNRGHVDTRIVNQYLERIYLAVLTDNDTFLRELQDEIHLQETEFRAAVWSGLGKHLRDKLRDVCPELL
jgi:hypothetical protein